MACHAPALSPVRQRAHAVTYASSGALTLGTTPLTTAAASAFLLESKRQYTHQVRKDSTSLSCGKEATSLPQASAEPARSPTRYS